MFRTKTLVTKMIIFCQELSCQIIENIKLDAEVCESMKMDETCCLAVRGLPNQDLGGSQLVMN